MLYWSNNSSSFLSHCLRISRKSKLMPGIFTINILCTVFGDEFSTVLHWGISITFCAQLQWFSSLLVSCLFVYNTNWTLYDCMGLQAIIFGKTILWIVFRVKIYFVLKISEISEFALLKYQKIKPLQKRTAKSVCPTMRILSVYTRARSGLFNSLLEILMSKIQLDLVGQLRNLPRSRWYSATAAAKSGVQLVGGLLGH